MTSISEQPEWAYTGLIKAQFGETYAGRRLIERDQPISGGVYYGTYDGEAIVVDPEKYPEEYDKWFELARTRASKDGEIERDLVLGAAYDTVLEQMSYSKDGVNKVLSDIAVTNGFNKFPDGLKVELDAFMANHVGVCRHQALAIGVLLEKFKSAGAITGQISIDRNADWSPKGERVGHAWIRYTNSQGEIFILDAANRYIGTIEDSIDTAGWNYLRPEEIDLYQTA